MEDDVRAAHHLDLNAAALLQRRCRDPRGFRVLAAHGLLPGGDVHRAEEDKEVEHEVGLPADAELCVPRHLRRSRCRISGRGGA